MSLFTRRTGCGAASIPFQGTKLTFDERGEYPTSSMEYYISKNIDLQRRNDFLEDVLYRAINTQMVDDDDEYEYIESPPRSP